MITAIRMAINQKRRLVCELRQTFWGDSLQSIVLFGGLAQRVMFVPREETMRKKKAIGRKCVDCVPTLLRFQCSIVAASLIRTGHAWNFD
jgi:hypothetical protein